jgi:hypothetical protein
MSLHAALRRLGSVVRPHPLATAAVISTLALVSASWLAGCGPTAPGARVVRIGLTAPVGPVQRSCRGVEVVPGDDLQAAIQNHSSGTTFCLTAGTYRLSAPLVPKRGDALIGRPGARLSGSRVLTGWRSNGRAWSTRGFLPKKPDSYGQCLRSEPTCSYAEDVFLDHGRLRRVHSPAEVVEGTVYADYAANTITIGSDPRGHLLEQAVAPGLVRATVDDVTIANLVLEEAANEAQTAAVESRQVSPVATGLRWRILNNEIRLNHGVGVGFGGGSTIANNAIHHQGQLGFGAWGDDTVIDNNEISFNGVAGYSGWWEAGGSKSWFTDNQTISHNDVHDNLGPGLWADGGNMNTTYEYNRIADNSGPGIQHEISYDAVIRYNQITGNGWRRDGWGWDAGIQIQSSGGNTSIEIAHNVVVGNVNAITVLDSGDRDQDPPTPYGPHVVRNISVHDNFVSLFGEELTGGFEDRNSRAIFTTNNVRFSANTYYVDSVEAGHFAWDEGHMGWRRWHGHGYGNDLDGLVLVSEGVPDLARIIADSTDAIERLPPS